jgi:ArsR family transcriptional regulator
MAIIYEDIVMNKPDKKAIRVEGWREPAELLRLVAHPVRLMVLSLLCEKPQCVKDLNILIPLVQPHLSQHMAALRQAQVVDFYTSGTMRCYYIIRPSLVQNLIALLKGNHPAQKRDRQWVLRQSKRSKHQNGKGGGPRLQEASAQS